MSVISFRHLHNVSTIGSGSVKFKVYAPYQLPQLATPQNVSASGTTVSWGEVANAESYDIYIDGTLYENTTGGATLINFTIEGTSYQAEEDMTWAQWVNSNYNTSTPKYYINSFGDVVKGSGGGGGARVTTDSAYNNSVSSTDIITATAYYYGMAN